MGSINAQHAAIKVLETVRQGKKVNLGKILKENGYSDTTATVPTQVTNTKSYRTALALEQKPLLEQLALERQKIMTELSNRKLKGEEYRTLIGSLDIITRNYQLLSGGATQRQVFVLPSEVMEKNSIALIEPKDTNSST